MLEAGLSLLLPARPRAVRRFGPVRSVEQLETEFSNERLEALQGIGGLVEENVDNGLLIRFCVASAVGLKRHEALMTRRGRGRDGDEGGGRGVGFDSVEGAGPNILGCADGDGNGESEVIALEKVSYALREETDQPGCVVRGEGKAYLQSMFILQAEEI